MLADNTKKPLSYTQLVEIHKTLKRRFRHVEGLVSIGFGCARRSGRIDQSRGFSVCLYVRRKKARPRIAQRIPKCVELPPKLAKQLGLRKLPTDVVECVGAQSTGRTSQVEVGAELKEATCGLLVRWKQGTESRFGFLCVGHVFVGASPGQTVRIASADGLYRVYGEFIARTPQSQSLDTSLIEVMESSLAELAPESVSPPISVATGDQLIQDLQSDGSIRPLDARLLRSDGSRSFRAGVFHPQFFVDGVGYVKDLFDGLTSTGFTFQEGTSGAVWMTEFGVSCLQTASFAAGSFRRGLGQMIWTRTSWLFHDVLSHRPHFDTSSLTFHSIY